MDSHSHSHGKSSMSGQGDQHVPHFMTETKSSSMMKGLSDSHCTHSGRENKGLDSSELGLNTNDTMTEQSHLANRGSHDIHAQRGHEARKQEKKDAALDFIDNVQSKAEMGEEKQKPNWDMGKKSEQKVHVNMTEGKEGKHGKHGKHHGKHIQDISDKENLRSSNISESY
jgi:hypothetical protein